MTALGMFAIIILIGFAIRYPRHAANTIMCMAAAMCMIIVGAISGASRSKARNVN